MRETEAERLTAAPLFAGEASPQRMGGPRRVRVISRCDRGTCPRRRCPSALCSSSLPKSF